MIEAWHFTSDTLRDGSPIPEPGVKLIHAGDDRPFVAEYHGSVRPVDALRWAPGHMIHRVQLSGTIFEHGTPLDKYAASELTILWSANAEETLRHFARLCALDVIHLWDAPDIVREFLETGDGTKRNAALAAAQTAVWDAADAAWAARATRAAADAARAARDAARAALAAARAARAAVRDAQNARLESMLMALNPETAK